ncbi:hypothetical protein GCM10023169_00290 [Georgenia halophila]|uniref:Phage holin family protein n=1 Tax=Georgenia halophila TaxID=620889 RepID=A0ABP8KST9_9MICO
MTSQPVQNSPSSGTESTSGRLSWTLILGLGAMSLLWPLTGLTGIGGTGLARASLILGLTAVVWIAAVGLGRVARPVLTLTLAGVVYALVSLAVASFFGGLSGFGIDAVIPALIWGVLCGLVAAGVQKLLAAVTGR